VYFGSLLFQHQRKETRSPIQSENAIIRYANYTKAEWCYAFHHAGLPAMIAGTDTQGAQYIQKRKTDFA